MGEPVSLSPEKQKSQSRRLNDLGTASSSKKQRQIISRACPVKANSYLMGPVVVVSSPLPPRRRITTKIIPIRTNSITSAIPIFIGVNKPDSGVGAGVAAAGGAFFPARAACAYCKRCCVS
jgi:hypothetical protein